MPSPEGASSILSGSQASRHRAKRAGVATRTWPVRERSSRKCSRLPCSQLSKGRLDWRPEASSSCLLLQQGLSQTAKARPRPSGWAGLRSWPGHTGAAGACEAGSGLHLLVWQVRLRGFPGVAVCRRGTMGGREVSSDTCVCACVHAWARVTIATCMMAVEAGPLGGYLQLSDTLWLLTSGSSSSI